MGSDNPLMRRPLLALLAFCGVAFAPPQTPLPRGDGNFALGWTLARLDSALEAQGTQVVSRGFDYVTVESPSPEVEFVQYWFFNGPHGSSSLWKATIAYRVPYSRDLFESVRGMLVEDLGSPAEEHLPDPGQADPVAKVSWVDVRTSVQLGARWPERPDPRADRMIVTWTDRRLQKQVEAQRKGKAKK